MVIKKKFKRIYIEITNICNLKCSFCSISYRDKKSIDIKQFKKIITEVKNYTDYVYLHVRGEPLIHKNIGEFLEVLKTNNLKVNLTTNGTLLNCKKSILFQKDIVRQISISLQSGDNFKDEKKYKYYIDKTLEFVQDGLRKTDIIFELRLWNYNKAYGFLNKNTYALNKIKEIFGVNLRAYEEVEKDKGVRLLKNLYLSKEYEFIWPSLKNETIQEIGTCYGTRQQIGILSNGTVIPCCLDYDGDLELGNIFEEQLDEILEKNRFKKIKKGFEENKLLEELCQKCGFIKKSISY